MRGLWEFGSLATLCFTASAKHVNLRPSLRLRAGGGDEGPSEDSSSSDLSISALMKEMELGDLSDASLDLGDLDLSDLDELDLEELDEADMDIDRWLQYQVNTPVPEPGSAGSAYEESEESEELSDVGEAGETSSEEGVEASEEVGDKLADHREAAQNWLAAKGDAKGFTRVRLQMFKLVVLHFSAGLLRKGCKSSEEYLKNVRVSALILMVVTTVLERLVLYRIAKANDETVVKAPAQSVLGWLQRKEPTSNLLTAKEYDIKCLTKCRAWCLLYLMVGWVLTYLIGDAEPLYIGSALGMLRMIAEPVFFIHILRGGKYPGKRPFVAPNLLTNLLGAPFGFD